MQEVCGALAVAAARGPALAVAPSPRRYQARTPLLRTFAFTHAAWPLEGSTQGRRGPGEAGIAAVTSGAA
jgi:hypothetical protein